MSGHIVAETAAGDARAEARPEKLIIHASMVDFDWAIAIARQAMADGLTHCAWSQGDRSGFTYENPSGSWTVRVVRNLSDGAPLRATTTPGNPNDMNSGGEVEW